MVSEDTRAVIFPPVMRDVKLLPPLSLFVGQARAKNSYIPPVWRNVDGVMRRDPVSSLGNAYVIGRVICCPEIAIYKTTLLANLCEVNKLEVYS